MTFPKDMFLAVGEPIIVRTEQEYEAALRKGYSETYIHQAYPRACYGKTHTAAEPDVIAIANPDEHKAASAAGYLDMPPVPDVVKAGPKAKR